MNTHEASAEQWRQIEQLASSCIYDLVLVELRSRIEALEAAVNSRPTPNPGQIRSSQVGGLVERVSKAIVDGMVNGDREAALAAIHVVIEHLHRTAWHAAAEWLSAEMEAGDA